MAADQAEPRQPRGPGKSARNERRKLFAAWLNTLASATVTVGVLAPAAGILYGFSVPGADRAAYYLVLIASAWLMIGLIIHSFAHVILGGIEE